MSKMNPLAQYTKIEVLFTKLVSNGVMEYEDNVVSDIKCGVCARSARDEIILNTADALIGGDAVVKVIENCVPAVQNARKLFVNDVEQLLIAIKLATKDESYDLNVGCPECEHVGGFSRDLNYLLQTATSFDEVPTLVMDSGLTVYFTPHTWDQHSEFSTRMFHEHSKSRMIDQMDDSEEAEKIRLFGEVFENMAQLSYDMICASISKVVTPEDIEVTETEFISDWVGSLSSKELELLKEMTDKVGDVGINHTMDVQCSECNHEWQLTGLRYDPAHFFGLGFSSAPQKKSKK